MLYLMTCSELLGWCGCNGEKPWEGIMVTLAELNADLLNIPHACVCLSACSHSLREGAGLQIKEARKAFYISTGVSRV